MPSRAHDGDAGVDLYSAEDVELAPGHRALVSTGIAVAIPHGMVGLVHPRSGLAARVGLSIVNSPGTIDAGYRGEIKVSLINLDPDTPIVIRRGDRIAQLLVQRVELPELVEVASFDEAGLADTTRGRGRPRFLRRTCEFVMAFGRRKHDDDSGGLGSVRRTPEDAAETSDPRDAGRRIDDEVDGPFDIEDFDNPEAAALARLDLGSVLIPMPPGRPGPGRVQPDRRAQRDLGGDPQRPVHHRRLCRAEVARDCGARWPPSWPTRCATTTPTVSIEDGPWGREVVGAGQPEWSGSSVSTATAG